MEIEYVKVEGSRSKWAKVGVLLRETKAYWEDNIAWKYGKYILGLGVCGALILYDIVYPCQDGARRTESNPTFYSLQA